MSKNDSTDQRLDGGEQGPRWIEAEGSSRQSNILPLDAARNEGRFYGRLIRGNYALNGPQRIGFFLVGALFCWSAIFIVMLAFPRFFGMIGLPVALKGHESVSRLYLPVVAVMLFLGLKVIGRAVMPQRRKPQKAD